MRRVNNIIVKVISYENDVYSYGTGFIITEKSHILTAAHVLSKSNISIFVNNSLLPAKCIYRNNRLDIAILEPETHVNNSDYVDLSIVSGNCSCFTYGYMNDEITLSHQEGYIRSVNLVSDVYIDSLATTIKSFSGMSGSPIFCTDTRSAVGILTWSTLVGSGGAAFRIVADVVKRILQGECVTFGSIGVDVRLLKLHDAISLNIPSLFHRHRGYIVNRSYVDGIYRGDIITAIDGTNVGEESISIEALLFTASICKTVKLQVFQNINGEFKVREINAIVKENDKKYDKALKGINYVTFS